MKMLMRDSPGAPVDYNAFRQELKQRKAEISGLGWKNPQLLRDAACEQGVLEIAMVNGKMHSVKLLVPTEKPRTRTVKSPQFEPATPAQNTLESPGPVEQQTATLLPSTQPTDSPTKSQPSQMPAANELVTASPVERGTRPPTLRILPRKPQQPVASVYAGPNSTPPNKVNSNRFAPLISIMEELAGGKSGALVGYQYVKRELKQRDPEIRSLGWKDYEQLRDVACKEGIVKIILVGGKMHSVKLLVPTEEPAIPAAKMPEPEPGLVYFALDQTILDVSGFTEEQQMYMAHLTPQMRNAYPNLDDEALTSLVVSYMFGEGKDNEVGVALQEVESLPVSPYGDIELEPPEADIAPDAPSIRHALGQSILDGSGFTEEQQTYMAHLTPQMRNAYPNLDDEALMSLVVSYMFGEGEGNEQWMEQVNEARQRIRVTLQEESLSVSPYSTSDIESEPSSHIELESSSSDVDSEPPEADTAPDVTSITHETLLATISQLVDGTNDSQVLMSDVLRLLQAQYPNADVDDLFSFVMQAEEERVVRCKQDEKGVDWISAISRKKILPIPTTAQASTTSDAADPPSSPLVLQKDAQGHSNLEAEVERKLRGDGGHLRDASYPLRPVQAAKPRPSKKGKDSKRASEM
ncbi:hypothetical protein M408DRAFT_333839 [Serendipita vermifera MAFF 305830]|uniref:Uncharacterized protein n=1 Tax=Serendipita vermifera MAFF 305830 TaxID=933852 RepID=A0A0C2W2L2_SERVB|nr:hypothetical protein M408DRAFT_333839 [Serendipita vermifera MAFF 305830]